MGLMGPNVLEMNENEVANNLGTTCTVKQKWCPGMILTAPYSCAHFSGSKKV